LNEAENVIWNFFWDILDNEDENNTFHRNDGKYLPFDTTNSAGYLKLHWPIIIIIIIFLHRLGRLTCSGIHALPSFPRSSTIPSSSGFVGEGVFRESGVVQFFEVADPVLFVFESHVLYSRDL